MPIIGNVGRKTLRVRFLNGSIHLVLIIGAVTMLYPFLIMVSGSFKSRVDSKVFNILPRYFYSNQMLFRKYVEARLNENTALLASLYKNRFIAFEVVVPPEKPNKAVFEDWRTFTKETQSSDTVFDFYVSEESGYGVQPRNMRKFRNEVKKECNRNLTAYNKKYNASIETWDEVAVSEPPLTRRNFQGNYEGILARYREFKLSLPLWERVYVSLDGEFIEQELKPLYRSKLQEMNEALGTHYPSWDNVHLARRVPTDPLRKHWITYVKETLNLQFIRVDKEAAPLYRNFLKEKYGDVGLMNRTYGTPFKSFDDIPLLETIPRAGAQFVDWSHFIENIVPPERLRIVGMEFRYRDWLKTRYKTISALNTAHGKGLNSFEDATLPSEAPETNLAQMADWLSYVRDHAQPAGIELKMTCQREWLTFVTKRFPTPDGKLDVVQLNKTYGTNFDEAMNVYPSRRLPAKPLYMADWLAFVRTAVSPQFIILHTQGEQAGWQAFLAKKHQTVEKLNTDWGLIYKDFETVSVDHWVIDSFIFRAHKSNVFREFLKRNYVTVLTVFLYNGRAIINTIIYCALAIFTALLVNPLAAYAMSRYKLPSSYKIILVLMLTMAFPPMVMGIPAFLLIKNLGLLNTFLALILPAAADGYFIFLLKGFFDSLPRELFECATIDGAKERQIFWNVAMALSKPIMAVIALNAFNAAYRNFMMAFLVCQDRSMWTLMVHIYQLIQRSSQGVGFAALVVASIPTFGVFVFCQNIIIRGIVVPTEK